MDDPKSSHLLTIKRILSENSYKKLIGYTDLDRCGDLVERKITTNYLLLLQLIRQLMKIEGSIQLLIDNKSTINLIKNSVARGR
ncbi:hypothetical protein CR513_18779, partial [Mucuna pruriens]